MLVGDCRGMLGLVPNSVTSCDVVIPIEGLGEPLIVSRLDSKKRKKLICVKDNACVSGMMAEGIMEDEVIKEWECPTFI